MSNHNEKLTDQLVEAIRSNPDMTKAELDNLVRATLESSRKAYELDRVRSIKWKICLTCNKALPENNIISHPVHGEMESALCPPCREAIVKRILGYEKRLGTREKQ